MNIVTKYDIGHRCWVARCIKRVHEEEMEHNGHIWVRTYFTFEPLVKQKEINAIEIRVDKNKAYVSYGTLNVGDHYSELSQWYPEKNIENYTKEEAEQIAEEYAKNCQEYFGVDEVE